MINIYIYIHYIDIYIVYIFSQALGIPQTCRFPESVQVRLEAGGFPEGGEAASCPGGLT